jgi:hypothetical protein
MALVSLVNAELMAREGLDADAMRDAATDLLGHLGVVSVPSVLRVLRQT